MVLRDSGASLHFPESLLYISRRGRQVVGLDTHTDFVLNTAAQVLDEILLHNGDSLVSEIVGDRTIITWGKATPLVKGRIASGVQDGVDLIRRLDDLVHAGEIDGR
jgi:hypothetical protein